MGGSEPPAVADGVAAPIGGAERRTPAEFAEAVGSRVMYHSLNFRGHVSCLAAGTTVVYFIASWAAVSQAAAEGPSSRPLYHTDPGHLRNRLHEAMFVWVGPDGRAYGQDRLEPLLWANSKHLLEDRSHERAVALLEEFLKNKEEKLIDDPLKRAVLQRDLWLVFNWVDGRHNDFAEPKLTPMAAGAARERLRGPLAAVIGRLALSPQEIRNLPDNYAAAIVSGQFAKGFAIEKHDQPYLPPDLFAAVRRISQEFVPT